MTAQLRLTRSCRLSTDEVIWLLRGDLTDASPEELLRDLGGQQATGCLVIEEPTGHGESDTQIHLRAGKVYAAALAGGTFLVGTRLTTSYDLTPDALEEALEAQRAELHGWRLGEILVHLGHVDASAVDQISREQVLEIVTETCSWRTGAWRFRTGDRTRAMLTHPVTVPELFAAVHARQDAWHALLPALGSAEQPITVTGLAPTDASPELASLLAQARECGAQGLRVVSHAAGLSLLEGGRLAVAALTAGLLEMQPALDLVVGGGIDLDRGSRSLLTPRPAPAPAPVAPAVTPAATPSTSVPTSHALLALLALPGSVAAVQPEPPKALAHEGATVLDLSAARAARSGEHAVNENAAHVAVQSLRPSLPPPAEPPNPPPVQRNGAEAELAALELAAREDRARAAAAREQDEQDRRARVLAEEARESELLRREAALELEQQKIRERAAEQARRELEAERALEEAERERQRQVQLNATTAADDDEALELAAALRAAAASQAFHTRSHEAAPASSRDEAVESVTAEPATLPAESRPTWGQGFISASPPSASDQLGMFAGSRDPLADTASLMRELTSLGLSEDEQDAVARPPVPPPPPPRPAFAAPAEKKRKGLFGR